MNAGVVFYKMTGSGNDFVMFDGRYLRAEELTPEWIVALCDRRLGVGADGVALLEPSRRDGVHFAFHFWNRDGSPGPMCGNGALCATRLATLLEFARPDEEVRFSTPAGVHHGRVVEEGAGVEILLPDCPAPKAAPSVQTVGGEQSPTLVHPSVPHLVLRVADVDLVELDLRGPLLRRDPAIGEGGANVNWVSPKGDGTWRMRTFERGVEGETLACGTGAVASALALDSQNLAEPPVRMWTRSGMPLDITWNKSSPDPTSIHLRGEGRVVYKGILGTLLTQDGPKD
jgi:diaminopimelate epimerase